MFGFLRRKKSHGTTISSLRFQLESALNSAAPTGFKFDSLTLEWIEDKDAWKLSARMLPEALKPSNPSL